MIRALAGDRFGGIYPFLGTFENGLAFASNLPRGSGPK